VIDAFLRFRIQVPVDVLEIHKGKVFDVKIGEIEWTGIEYRTPEIRLGIGPPADTGLFQKAHKMFFGGQLRLAGLRVRQDAEVRSRLEPDVVGLAGVVARRIELLLRMGGGAEQLPVDVGSERAPLEIRRTELGAGVVAGPIVVFHQHDPHSFHFAELCPGVYGHQHKQTQCARKERLAPSQHFFSPVDLFRSD
jgi:hypothetical protein